MLFTIQNNEPVNDARSQMSVDFNTNQNYIFARAASMELTSCDFFWDIGGDLTDFLALLPATFLTLFFRASAFLAAFLVMAACVDGTHEAQTNQIWGESWSSICMCVCIRGRRCSPGVHPGNNFILTRQPVTSWNDYVQMDSMDHDESKMILLGASTKLPAYKAEIRFIYP